MITYVLSVQPINVNHSIYVVLIELISKTNNTNKKTFVKLNVMITINMICLCSVRHVTSTNISMLLLECARKLVRIDI